MISHKSVHRTAHHLAYDISLGGGGLLQLLTVVIRHTSSSPLMLVFSSISVDIATEMIAEVAYNHLFKRFHRQMLPYKL